MHRVRRNDVTSVENEEQQENTIDLRRNFQIGRERRNDTDRPSERLVSGK